MAKKASVASVVPKCSPYMDKDIRVMNREAQAASRHQSRRKLYDLSNSFFYLVEQIDNLGENVEASSWVYWRLIEDTCLETRTDVLYLTRLFSFFSPFMFRFHWFMVNLRRIRGDLTSCNTALFSRCWNGFDPLPTRYNNNMIQFRRKHRSYVSICFHLFWA